jgi:hypothetical protein
VGIDHPFFLELDRFGLLASVQLSTGQWLCVQPLTFGAAQVAITRDVAPTVGEALAIAEFGSYADVWHYATVDEAIAAAQEWAERLDRAAVVDVGTSEPEGWIRHPGSGRRRRADGTLREAR